jgi:hypothetical protein
VRGIALSCFLLQNLYIILLLSLFSCETTYECHKIKRDTISVSFDTRLFTILDICSGLEARSKIHVDFRSVSQHRALNRLNSATELRISESSAQQVECMK